MRSFQINHIRTHSPSAIGHRVRIALVASALIVTLGGTAQSVLAGPVAPPPGM